MKTNSLPSGETNLAVIALGILAALLIFAVLTERKLPLLSSDRAAVLVLIVIGMAICSQAGIGRVAANQEWTHPLSMLGYLLGAAIIVIGIATLFGKLIPPITSFHQAFLAVTVIAVAKVILATIHRLFL